MPKKISFQQLILIIIFLAGFFLRFYKLAEYPVHLGHDEVSQLYDAISISETGKDIYGNSYPAVFKSVNDYKAPFYIYATSVAFKLFGWQDLTARIVGAVAGSLIVLAIYFFVNEFLKNKTVSLFASLLTAISPFEIFYSRKSFENQSGILLMILGFTLIKKKKIFLGTLLLGFSSYIYFSQAILVPVLLTSFLVIYRGQFKTIILKIIILFLLVSAPLYYLVNTNPDISNRSRAVFISQDQTLGSIDKLNLAKSAAVRYLDQFNFRYLFLDGLDMTNGKRDVGPLFPVILPFMFLGGYMLLQDVKNRNGVIFIFVLIFVNMIPSGLTFEGHSPHRAIAVFTMINAVSAVGIYEIVKKCGKVAVLLVLILLVSNFAFFVKRYLINYPIERSESLHYPFTDIAKFAWENYDDYERIIFDPKFGEFAPWIGTGAHYYLAYYGHYPPSKMQKEFRIGDQRFRETKFDKFSIRAVFWPDDHSLKKTLIIASPWSLPPDIVQNTNIIKRFYFKTTAPAFYAISL